MMKNSCLRCMFSLLLLSLTTTSNGFHLVMMGRRGKGNLKKALAGESVSSSKKSLSSSSPGAAGSLNQGRGQEILGVTLPADGKLKGWEFGEKVRLVCANVGGRFYAVQGDCPRCGFDLWKGDLIANDAAFEDLPRVACPTCSTTFSLASGKYGPAFKRTGLAGFVGNLAKSATAGEAAKNAKAFQITLDETGRVFCREKNSSNKR